MEDSSLPTADATTSASAANAASRVVVHNPYASKKRPKIETTTTARTTAAHDKEPPILMTSRDLLLQHLQLPPDEQQQEDVGNPEERHKDDASSSGLETQPSNVTHLPDQSTSATVRADSDVVLSQPPQKAAATRANTPLLAPQKGQVNDNNSCPSVPLVVSQQLSFGSAEILTIPEFLQHCDALFRANKSVRITGRLTHRILHSTTMVSLLLDDPLVAPCRGPTTKTAAAALTASKTMTTLTMKDTRLYTTTSSGSNSATTTPTQRPPSLGGRPNNNNKYNNHTKPTRSSRLASSSSLTTTSRRLVYKKKGLRTVASADNTRTNSDTNTTKTQFPPLPPEQESVETLVTSLVMAKTTTTKSTVAAASSSSSKSNHDKSSPAAGVAPATVWIIANPQHVLVQEDCMVGDLVMILGQVGCLQGNDKKNHRKNKNDGNATTNAVPGMLEQEDAALLEQIRVTMSTRASTAQHPLYYIAARICRNVNGTDMSLFTQALMTRRRFLRTLGNTSEKVNNGSNNRNSKDGVENEDCEALFLPGWGAPLASM